MLVKRPATERGRTQLPWLDSWHSFSFGEYFDRNHMHFRALRVINDDVIAPGGGFGLHPHRDMEIITVMIDGGLTHRDSMGHEATLRPGDMQYMRAGSGIQHSEFNASHKEPARLLQMWVMPDVRGAEPTYTDRHIAEAARRDKLALILARDGRDGALQINQDADVYLATLSKGASVSHGLQSNRHAWVQVGKGAIDVNGVALQEGDGIAMSGESGVTIAQCGEGDAQVVLFDLA